MKSVLIVYFSRGGHTARIARRIAQTIVTEGCLAEVMDVIEADHEGVTWEKYDLVILGCPIRYGRYPKAFMQFVSAHHSKLCSVPHSFFNVSGIARSAASALPGGNRYMLHFLKISPWKPKDVQCFAGNIDYPHYNYVDKQLIRLIMLISGGPTDTRETTDFTNWESVKTYARHCLSLI